MSATKVIVLDIETSPLLSYTWGTWDQNVLRVNTDFTILCYAWKDLGVDNVQVVSRPDFKGYKKDRDNDLAICGSLHDLLSESDIVIAHNGDKFDLPKTSARLVYHGFAPPTPYQTIDTLKIARRHFAFSSNKLDDLGRYLGLGHKEQHHGIDTWLGCMYGDKEEWNNMTTYNIQDVILLESVYEKLIPWAEGTPNRALLDDNPTACPTCGSSALTKQGFKKTRTMTYQRYQCSACGAWSRGRMSEKDADKPLAVN